MLILCFEFVLFSHNTDGQKSFFVPKTQSSYTVQEEREMEAISFKKKKKKRSFDGPCGQNFTHDASLYLDEHMTESPFISDPPPCQQESDSSEA
ncbi:hypothetical protein INR49_012135 [Caranx melampygus]|nr:hypothetical protein INR49_012135 [Caranx melampygus]